MAMLRVIVIVMVIALGPGHWSAQKVPNNLVLKHFLVLVSENLVSEKIAEYPNGKLFLGLVSRIFKS